ncbi:uncharacterized protein FOMMEDRAFT_26966 [Fomitiporia mediterranea MF3/22]|uniref:uncharacterized protein n=1 Tax=Fomitiporia mediterranea (strain MF3/22) TaxID=694068 RepID=UPI000440959E|nr:uncharacterized protein FOMMEDRAFT_26966 [Fomitiporia mediterranea MF3/22]EJD06247.1 hypothetical protein FOMMEDRAFT_26966 [Fomitiporia mediterranea MF3/22]
MSEKRVPGQHKDTHNTHQRSRQNSSAQAGERGTRRDSSASEKNKKHPKEGNAVATELEKLVIEQKSINSELEETKKEYTDIQEKLQANERKLLRNIAETIKASLPNSEGKFVYRSPAERGADRGLQDIYESQELQKQSRRLQAHIQELLEREKGIQKSLSNIEKAMEEARSVH